MPDLQDGSEAELTATRERRSRAVLNHACRVVVMGKCLRVKVPLSVWAKIATIEVQNLFKTGVDTCSTRFLNGVLFWPHLKAPPPEHSQNST